MSEMDIARMNAMYNCPVAPPPTSTTHVLQIILAALKQFFSSFLGGLFSGM